MGNVVPFLLPPLFLPTWGILLLSLLSLNTVFPPQVISEIMVQIKKPTGKQDVDSTGGDGRNTTT